MLVQTTDGNDLWLSEILHRSRERVGIAGTLLCALPWVTFIHPTLYYHLSNSLTALAELLTVFFHKDSRERG